MRFFSFFSLTSSNGKKVCHAREHSGLKSKRELTIALGREKRFFMLQNPPRFYHIPSHYNHVIIEAYCMRVFAASAPVRPGLC